MAAFAEEDIDWRCPDVTSSHRLLCGRRAGIDLDDGLAGEEKGWISLSLLTETEFQQTFAAPMTRVPQGQEPPFDFWPYFEEIPSADFSGHDCSSGTVTYVYRHPAGRFEHVLVDSKTRDVFMILVLDRQSNVVLGHRLLDLPRLYGQSED